MGETVNRIGALSSVNTKDLKQQGNESLSKDVNIFENTCTGSTKPCVVIIDDFKDKDIDIDGNEDTSEITHGDAVSSFIKSGFPEAKFIKYDISGDDSESLSDKKIINSLKNIQQRIDADQKINAVNISIGLQNEQSITNEDNLTKSKENLKIKFRNDNKVEDKEVDLEEIALIEQIVKKGTPVFVAAGNGGSEKYNSFNLAEGATSVGAKEKYNGKNFLINIKEQSIFPIKIVSSDKRKNQTCFDYTEDGKADYCGTYVDPKEFSNKLEGTSFSTPKALGKYLKKKYKEGE